METRILMSYREVYSFFLNLGSDVGGAIDARDDVVQVQPQEHTTMPTQAILDSDEADE